jgi:dTDP-4-amino-4,6-dideoxygalactose transaminase
MIQYGRHSIDESDISAVIEVLKSDWLTTGPLVEEFEANLMKVTGAPTVVVSSGTAALHCAFQALELKPGDEIISPPLTFVATQATAILSGAKTVFADIDSETGNLDPNEVLKRITPRTVAITTVDYAGHPGALDELRKIADEHRLYLIQDAAHSLGSTYFGKRVGEIADLTTFSFFPTKNIASGEGGAISSQNPELLQRAKLFARQGLIRDRDKFMLSERGGWHQEVQEFGINYRLPDVLCALGNSQLKRISGFKDARTHIFDFYNREFAGISELTLPTRKHGIDPMWHLYPLRIRPDLREGLFNFLRENGIGVQVNYIPAYWHPAFDAQAYPPGLCPNAEDFYGSEVSLPIHPLLTEEQLLFICEKVKEFLVELT